MNIIIQNITILNQTQRLNTTVAYTVQVNTYLYPFWGLLPDLWLIIV